MKSIMSLVLILSTSCLLRAQITSSVSSWTTAYSNEEYGLNYKAGAVPLNKRVSATAGTGTTQAANIPISGIGSNIQIRKVFLWFSIVGQTTAVTSFPSLTVKNPMGTSLAISNLTCVSTINNAATSWQGTAGTNFASGYTHNYRAEITLAGGSPFNGNYTISGLPTTISTNPDVDVTGATLMIIYKDNLDCTKGSLHIQDTYMTEAICFEGSFASLNMSFALPPVNSPYTQFANAVDYEKSNAYYQLHYPSTPGATFNGDMWNFVSQTNPFNNGGATAPQNWLNCTDAADSDFNGGMYDQGFTSVRGFYWRSGTIGNITSSFNISSVNCSGVINVNGSASTGPITNHFWEIVETNSSGMPVLNGYTYSTWLNGVPGNFSFPAAPCGKYYRVKLATKSACQPWVETSQIRYVPCPPSLKLDKTPSEICSGESGALSVTITGANPSNCNMVWTPISPSGPAIYNGVPASIIVFPTVTTTYQCTVTDVTTGCVATIQKTITVRNNNPTFSPYCNTTQNNYFTVLFTPNDQSAQSQPGFLYELSIEEVSDANATTSYYINMNANWSTCWWDYPNPDNFEGFNGTINPAGGSYSQSTCTTPQPAGKFLYDHWYRVIRKTKNDYCDWKAYSYIFKVPHPTNLQIGDQNSFLPLEGHEDVSMDQSIVQRALMLSENSYEAFSISPNPSNGIFTIQMDHEKEANVEVLDAQGRTIMTFNHSGITSEIDLTNFPKGMYLVKVNLDGNVSSQKIVLE